MKLNLYWVQTNDHCEDWFIVAQDVHQAERLHEDLEGYERDYAEAELIAPIPVEMNASPGWPSEELLLALGAKYKENGTARVIEIGGRTYCEGLLEQTLRALDDDRFEALGGRRVNGTQGTPRERQ